MATGPDDTFSLAREARVDDLSTDAGLVRALRRVHYLVLAANPDALVKQRAGGERIYVHPSRVSEPRDRNLMTVWVERVGVRIRIMPAEKETYDPQRLPEYLERLLELDHALQKRGV